MAMTKVKTENGWLQGLALEPGISVFRGVPYAAPPVGPLRWRAPKPAADWDGVRDATKWGNANMHMAMPGGGAMSMFRPEAVIPYDISEDSLYLNIWTPAETDTDKLPVAVYFHGGAAHAIKPNFDGCGFAKRGVIMITVGFRTEFWGGFATRELSEESFKDFGVYTSGNNTLLDKVAAVKWVRRNIAAFGGDPDRITVFGQSAGGTAAQRVSSTPLLKGELFGVIMQSAGGFDLRYMSNFRTLEECEKHGEEILAGFGVKTIEEARQLDAFEVMKMVGGGPENGMRWFCPKPDGWSLTDSPEGMAFKGDNQDIHMMIGSTKHEGFGGPPDTPPMERFLTDITRNYGAERVDEYLKISGLADDPELLKFVSKNDNGDLKLGTLMSWVQRQNELGRKPFVYMFTKEEPGGKGHGAMHSAEHGYVFQTLDRYTAPYDESDYRLSDAVCGYWTNFVKYGDPNGAGLPRWEATVRTDPARIMELGLRVGMEYAPETPISGFIRRESYAAAAKKAGM